jgi:hypothetical protein
MKREEWSEARSQRHNCHKILADRFYQKLFDNI